LRPVPSSRGADTSEKTPSEATGGTSLSAIFEEKQDNWRDNALYCGNEEPLFSGA
jgi:hypothetical protein